MDIATLLESHRRYMLEVVKDYVSSDELDQSEFAIKVAHDRATTKTLLDLYRQGQTGPNGEVKPLGQAALTTPAPIVPSRRVKAGSKKAKERAIKAGETRRKNLAAKQEQIDKSSNVNNAGPALSPATHMTPLAPPEGGAA